MQEHPAPQDTHPKIELHMDEILHGIHPETKITCNMAPGACIFAIAKKKDTDTYTIAHVSSIEQYNELKSLHNDTTLSEVRTLVAGTMEQNKTAEQLYTEGIPLTEQRLKLFKQVYK